MPSCMHDGVMIGAAAASYVYIHGGRMRKRRDMLRGREKQTFERVTFSDGV